MKNDEKMDTLSQSVRKMNQIEKDEMQALGQNIDEEGNILPPDPVKSKFRQMLEKFSLITPKRGEKSIATNKLSRRDFLKTVGLAAAGSVLFTPDIASADEVIKAPEIDASSRNLFAEFIDLHPDSCITTAQGYQLPVDFPHKWSEIKGEALNSLRLPLDGGLMERQMARFNVERKRSRHMGIDIHAQLNQKIICPLDGIYYDGWDTYARIDENPDGGSGRMSMVESRHPIWIAKDKSGKTIPYHLTIILGHVEGDCKVVDKAGNQIHDGHIVVAGDDAGNIGLTGNTSAAEPHLHFEMRIGQKLPADFGGSPISFPDDSVPIDPTELWMYLQDYSKAPPPHITTSKTEYL